MAAKMKTGSYAALTKEAERLNVAAACCVWAGVPMWIWRAWFARHPRFHLHFTPTSGSWLNLVERWFALLTERQIKRGSHRSTIELERAIHDYLAVHNQNPTPFVWHKTADQIIESVNRFCTRINDSVH